MKGRHERSVFCILALAVAGCIQLSRWALVQVTRLDPLETPLQDIMVVVGVRDSIRLNSGDAMVCLAFEPEDPAIPTSQVSIPLTVIMDETVQVPLRDSETVEFFGLAPVDAA